MTTRVLTTADAVAWRDALARLPGADAYDLPEYHRVAERNGEGEGRAFVVAEGDDLFVHAFLVRPIERVGEEPVDGGWCDLETVYGYGGPLATSGDGAFLARCWRAFGDWCTETKVVAEFVRFNPLRRNESLAAPGTALVLDRETVVVELAGGPDALWHSYPSVQRNMVRKAEKAGLEASEAPFAPNAAVFRTLYLQTIERVDADQYYAFGDEYFAALADLGGRVRLFEVRRGGELAAAALFLVHGTRMHYHLAATSQALRPLAPGNLLLHAAARWGSERDVETLHLGGGRTSAPDDALLRFKAGVSRVRLPFFTGRRVHHQRMYDDLCSRWLQQARPASRLPYFLLYRLPVEA